MISKITNLALAPCLRTVNNQMSDDPYWSDNIYVYWWPDATHVAQGSASDHNNWLYGLYRALDLMPIGDVGMARVYEFRTMWNQLFAAGDNRCAPMGYTNGPDTQISDWDHPGQLHYNGGDVGHGHVSASRNLSGCNRTDAWPLTNQKQQQTLSIPVSILEQGEKVKIVQTSDAWGSLTAGEIWAFTDNAYFHIESIAEAQALLATYQDGGKTIQVPAYSMYLAMVATGKIIASQKRFDLAK